MNRHGWKLLAALVLMASVSVAMYLSLESRAAAALPGLRISLGGRVPDQALGRWEQTAIRYSGKGLSELRQVGPSVDLDLKFDSTRSGAVQAVGNGLLRLGSVDYTMTIARGQSLDVAATADNRTIYYGGLSVSYRSDVAVYPGTIGFVYAPQTEQLVVSACIGTIGEELLLYFGEQFLTREELEDLASPH